MADGIGAEPALRRAVRDMHWMARRYCDMRSSYAPGLFNGLVRGLLAVGIELPAPLFARDGMGRAFDRLTDAEAAAAEADMPRALFSSDSEDCIARALAALHAAPDLDPTKATRAQVSALHAANLEAWRVLTEGRDRPSRRGEARP